MLTRRTQILLDEARYERLERRATETNSSIAAVIRDAIDVAVPDMDEAAAARRSAAARALLDAEPMPVDDWDVMKREMLDDAGFVDDPPE